MRGEQDGADADDEQWQGPECRDGIAVLGREEGSGRGGVGKKQPGECATDAESDAADDLIEREDARCFRLGYFVEHKPGHDCRDTADTEPEESHRCEGRNDRSGADREQPGRNDHECGEENVGPPRSDAVGQSRCEPSRDEAERGERDECSSRQKTRQAEAVAGACRGLDVSGEEREQKVHADAGGEHRGVGAQHPARDEEVQIYQRRRSPSLMKSPCAERDGGEDENGCTYPRCVPDRGLCDGQQHPERADAQKHRTQDVDPGS